MRKSRELCDPFALAESKCERCGEEIDETPISLVEAFEVTGEWLCDECAEEAFEAPSPEKAGGDE